MMHKGGVIVSTFVLFFEELVVLYGIAVLGYLAKKKRILNQAADQALTQILLYITLPCLILFSMNLSFSAEYLRQFGWLILLSAYALTTACLLARRLSRISGLPTIRQGVYEGLIIFGNQGFIGYAISYLLFAEQGVLYVAVFNLLYLFLIWTYGIYVIARKKNQLSWPQILLNPGVLATSLGLLVFVSPFSWPEPMSIILEDVGLTTIPLSMILIGSLVGELRFSEIGRLLSHRHIWLASAAKLIVIPALLIPFGWLDVPPALLIIAVLVTASPSAPTISLYAQKFGGDVRFSSMAVFLSTALSMLTIPLLYTVIRWLF